MVTTRVTEPTGNSTRFGIDPTRITETAEAMGNSNKVTKATEIHSGPPRPSRRVMELMENSTRLGAAIEVTESTGNSTRFGAGHEFHRKSAKFGETNTEATKEVAKVIGNDGKLSRVSQRGQRRLQLLSTEMRILTQAEML